MFRFTIRDVLWLTVAVALICGWISDRARLQLRLAEAEVRIRQWELSVDQEKSRLRTAREAYEVERAKLSAEPAPKR
jgi:hypothetical protein